MKIHVATYNIHKGFSQFNRRLMIHELRDHLRLLDADIIFLQEVQGQHRRHAARFEHWPDEPQYEFLAHEVWNDYAYGRNAVYDQGHHGNAILSRYPILSAENQDISTHNLESRGMLHCEIEVRGFKEPLHCVCLHLSLHERGRRHQVGALIERIHREVPDRAPLVVAGDFNDWRNFAGKRLAEALGLREAPAGPHLRPRIPGGSHADSPHPRVGAAVGPRGAFRAPSRRIGPPAWRSTCCPETA